MKVIKEFIHSSLNEIKGREYLREASRGIVLDGSKILLLYTKRYNDYSIPGGGIDIGEDRVEGLLRELKEETGGKNIKVLREIGIMDEYRQSRYEGYDYIKMINYFYLCTMDKKLGKANLEDYEIKNGMEARWIEIDEAINHNLSVLKEKEENMGISIERETYMLKYIKKNIINN